MVLLLPLLALPARASGSGTTGSATAGCGACHVGDASTAVEVAITTLTTTVAPGDVVPITVTVTSADGASASAGLDVVASGGAFTAGGDTAVVAGEITHTAPVALAGGSVTFGFDWTAPAVEGPYSLDGAGLAADGDGTEAGDLWGLAPTLVVTVDDGCNDGDGDGVSDCDGDCDDTDAAVFPGAVERCGGVDQDCDGDTDAGAIDMGTWYADLDADGYGDAARVSLDCVMPVGTVADATDCDDGDATVNPGATEVCDSRDVDEDCDGAADDADSAASGGSVVYRDLDGDGYGDITDSAVACDVAAGWAVLAGDCDDTNPAYNPGATEPDCTDPADYNCDGSTGYDDNDADGWSACQDCNDGAAAVHPGATETCNTLDDDCDGEVDESDAVGSSTWYRDSDQDGYGDPERTRAGCTAPWGYVADATDCDDDSGDTHPGAAETWYDGVDQDCDGRDDDRDGDGYGVAADCDDTDPATYPDAPGEVWYDGVDTDCHGNSDFDADGDGYDSVTFGGTDCDDGAADAYPGAPDDPYDGRVTDCDHTVEYDGDGDGWPSEAYGGEDCDDGNSSIHPGAEEHWYDGIDQDCDGRDNDQDGDGLLFEDDCDDTDPDIGPCDTADEPATDTGPPLEYYDPTADAGGCACDTSGGGDTVLALGLLLAGLVRRRR
jgi:hypothetical protein